MSKVVKEMETVLSPLFIVVAAILTIGATFFFRIPTLIIAFISALLLVYTLYIHIGLYSMDYSSISIQDLFKSMAPLILGLTIAAILIGLVLFNIGSKPSNAPNSSNGSNTSNESKSSWFSSFFKPAERPSKNENLTNSEMRNYASQLNKLI